MDSIKLFEDKKVRSHWDETEEQWYFSVVDVVAALTDSANAGLLVQDENPGEN